MTHTPHELAEEFPDHVADIHRLKSINNHFAKLADDHHVVNRQIHRSETNIEPVDDVTMENWRKQRLHLKDEIYAILVASEGS